MRDIPSSATPDAATGQYIPQNMFDQLANIDPDGDVNALADDFDIPTMEVQSWVLRTSQRWKN